MAKQDVIAGLDMGSGRVTCLIGSPDAKTQHMRVLGGASAVCRGINGGVVVNIQETARAVTQVVEEAETSAGATVGGLFLGVRGGHLQSFNTKGAFNIARTDKEITTDDIHSVVANAKAIPLSSDREILHVVPQSFSVDRQRGVPNPVGMEGALLEVEVHIITASSAHLNNVMKTVAQAGFEVQELIYGLLATGDQLVTPEEKDLGSLIVDLGGQSVSLGVYTDGGVRYTKELGIGADFITRDLAVGLRTSMATAERLKIAHGIAHPTLLNGDDDIEFSRVDGRTLDKVKTSTMMNIILPRVEEIFTVVADDLQKAGFLDVASPGGGILTGGGSLMRGVGAAADQILGLQTRIGMAHPEQVTGEERWFSPVYATALGLLTFANSSRWGTGVTRLTPGKKSKFIRRLNSFFEDIL